MGSEHGFAVITAVLVGLGHRSVGYASYADTHPDELQIVACLLYTSDAADE